MEDHYFNKLNIALGLIAAVIGALLGINAAIAFVAGLLVAFVYHWIVNRA